MQLGGLLPLGGWNYCPEEEGIKTSASVARMVIWLELLP